MDAFFEHARNTAGQNRATVVYVDDDEADLELFRVAAAHLTNDTEVVTFSDAASALDWCRGQALAPDLIAVDVNMPKFDGFRFLDEVRRTPRLDQTPVVFLSSSDDPGMMLEAREAGAVGFFVKPIGFARYTRMIRGLLSVPRRYALRTR